MLALDVFSTRDGQVTVEYQNDLLIRGKPGQLAFGLFRAQKRSTLAKSYRKRGHRGRAYDGKSEALRYVDAVATMSGSCLDGFLLEWGWGLDPRTTKYDQVLYCDLQAGTSQLGQCSFHSEQAYSRKKYPNKWDSSRASVDVVSDYCDWVMSNCEVVPLDEDDVFPFGRHVGQRFCDLDSTFFDWILQWDGLQVWSAIRPLVKALSNS